MAAKPVIVIDTNVVVAGLRSKRGWACEILSHVGKDLFDHCLSVPLVCEYEEVLKRLSNAVGLTFDEIDIFLDALCSRGQQTLIYFKVDPNERDPDDNNVLEAAIAGLADIIVSYNKRPFHSAASFGIKVLTPLEFLKEIGVLS